MTRLYLIKVSPTEIRTPDERIDYTAWWELTKNHDHTARVVLANEQRIEEQFRGILDADELFILKFILNNAVFNIDSDALLLSSQVVFFTEHLRRIFAEHKEGVVVELVVCRHHRPLRDLLRRLSKEYPHVTVKTPWLLAVRYGFYHRVLLPILLPAAIWTHYLGECMIAQIARILRRQRAAEKHIVLSNYRHYSPERTSNVFWGNLLMILQDERYQVIYYPQLAPFFFSYYKNQLADKKNRFLNDGLTLRGALSDFRTYIRRRRTMPRAFHYMIDGEERGEEIRPLIQAFYAVLMPYLLKNKRLLRRLLEQRPSTILLDSEQNLLAMQLGFLETKAKIVVLSNEVISRNYLMLPHNKGHPRPRFDFKVVYGPHEETILARHFKYPHDKLFRFPDPRFLGAIYSPKEMRDTILFISENIASFFPFTERFVDEARQQGLNERFSFVFKVHPLEAESRNLRHIAASASILRGPLTYAPRYAITHSSTLGIELLFHGTIVFFLDKVTFGIGKYFGIAKAVPFLICITEQDILRKIAQLEDDPDLAKRIRKEIDQYLDQSYDVKHLASRVDQLKRNLR